MKLVFFALGVAVGSLFFPKKQKADLPKGFAEGGYVQRPAHAEPKFVIVDERSNLGEYLFSEEGTKAIKRFIKKNRPDL